MVRVLVTGGAGYIGSHIVKFLLEKDYEVVVLDNLCKGHSWAVPENVKFYKLNLKDTKGLEEVFLENDIDAVMHLAGFIEVGDSMLHPEKFYVNNVLNTLNLLNVMLKFKVKKIIFSSSAAIFGIPKFVPISEDAEKKPINVYGKTKLIVESILDDYDYAYDLKSVCLRYFNACGAAYNLGEDHNPETHLIPLVLKVALGEKAFIKIFGIDYNTRDKTCVRDYVHVLDLAEAHILALEKLLFEEKSEKYNLGSGEGYSVKEIIETSRRITGQEIKAFEEDRRLGDPAVLIADSSKIRNELGWKQKYKLDDIIKSAWNWHKLHPQGFNENF